MKKILLMIVCVFGLFGCAATPPSQQEISNANYGALPSNYKEQIMGAMSTRLKDPASALYGFESPYKGYSQDGAWPASSGGVYYGWIAPVMINAKNSYGGYTGAQKYVFLFSNSVLYDVTPNDMFGRVKPAN